MSLTRQQKKDLMDQYGSILSSDKDVVLIEQRGLPVEDAVSFRKLLAETDANASVVKKRLLLQSAEKAGREVTDLGILSGSLLAMELNPEDYAPLKTVLKMNKEFKKSDKEHGFSFLGGWYGKTWKDAEYVTELASIPSHEELIGKFLYLLNYPVQSFAAVLNQIGEKQEETKES